MREVDRTYMTHNIKTQLGLCFHLRKEIQNEVHLEYCQVKSHLILDPKFVSALNSAKDTIHIE